MSFFSKFPLVQYNSQQIVTNIFFRIKILDAIKNNVYSYTPYRIKDGERIDTVAEKIYGDSYLHWLIVLANDFTDPLHDWPMDTHSFENYLARKYITDNIVFESEEYGFLGGPIGYSPIGTGSFYVSEEPTNPLLGIHHYEKRISRKNNSLLTNDITIIEITEEEYENTAESYLTNYNLAGGQSCEVLITTHAITYLEYETKKNDEKREIKVIRKDYVPQILNEFNTLSRSAKGLPVGYRTFA